MSEGLAHLKTKEILIRTKKIMLPYHSRDVHENHIKRHKVQFKFDEVLFEEKIGTFKADCLAIKGDKKLVIEIVDKGKTSNKKIEYYINNDIPSIEITFNMPKNIVAGTKYIDDFLDNRLEWHMHNMGGSRDLHTTGSYKTGYEQQYNYYDDIPYDNSWVNEIPGREPIMDKHWICNPKYGIYRELKESVSPYTNSGRPDMRTKEGRQIQKDIDIAYALEEQKKKDHFEMMKWKWENAKQGNQLVRRKKWRRGEDWGTY